MGQVIKLRPSMYTRKIGLHSARRGGRERDAVQEGFSPNSSVH